MRLAVPVVLAGGGFAAVLTATGAVAQDIKIGTIHDLSGPFAGGGSKPAYTGNKIGRPTAIRTVDPVLPLPKGHAYAR
jgi:hypothetical protein